MADTREQPIALQADTLESCPWAPIRTIVCYDDGCGQPTQVAMQVVAIADAVERYRI